MKTFRSILFWLHLSSGLFAGIVVLIMSVTGVLLTYEKQMLLWAETRTLQAGPPSPGAARMPVDDLLARVREQRPDATISQLALRANASSPAVITAGRDTIYVSAYTGAVLGGTSKGLRDFFRAVTDWHRWLGTSNENRAVGRAITGACNLAFLFLVVSGFYLWFPRRISWAQVRNVLWFRRGLPSKARDFNWHNVIGFWSAIPLFIIVLSGVVISYRWAGNLVYQAVGEQPPPPAQPAGGGGAAGGPGAGGARANASAGGERGARGGGERRPENARAEQGPRGDAQHASAATALTGTTTAPAPPAQTLDALWRRAEGRSDAWRIISARIPASASAPVVFTIDEGTGAQPQKRGTLTLDRRSGATVKWEPFASLSPGRRVRSWLRFAHTGEIYGLVGQTIAGIVSAGAAFLVYTGLALSWRRFFAWRARRAAARQPAPGRAAAA